MRFNRVWSMLLLLVSSGSHLQAGVELSATRLSAGFGQPALDYHLPTSLSPRSGRRDSNPRSRAPKARGLPLPYIPSSSQNGRI